MFAYTSIQPHYLIRCHFPEVYFVKLYWDYIDLWFRTRTVRPPTAAKLRAAYASIDSRRANLSIERSPRRCVQLTPL